MIEKAHRAMYAFLD